MRYSKLSGLPLWLVTDSDHAKWQIKLQFAVCEQSTFSQPKLEECNLIFTNAMIEMIKN